jgi:hypothetical protein
LKEEEQVEEVENITIEKLPEIIVETPKVEVKEKAVEKENTNEEKPVQNNEGPTTIVLSKHNSKDISGASKFIT